VEARYGDRVLRADEVYYYPERGRLEAHGNIVIVMEDGSIDFADSADFTEDFGEGVAVNFSMRLANDATAAAAYLERRDGTQNLLTRAVYSACPVCEEDPTPTWSFRARKALHDTEDEMIYYRDVTLRMGGVPVLYSPFFAHADPSVSRKSGLLMPTVGYSTTSGFRYEQPYFWAISPYEDLTISPVVSHEVAPLLGLEFRRQFYSGYLELDGSITKEQRFGSNGDKFGDDQLRGHLFGSGVFAIDDDWSWGFGAARITDFEYLYRYNITGQDVQRGLYGGSQFSGYLTSQLFVAGQDENFYSSVSAVDFQSLFQEGVNGALPTLLPTAEYRRTLDLDGFGRMEFASDVSVLERDTGLDYARVTGWADWRSRHVTDIGLVAEPFARARADYYRISDAFDAVTGDPASGSAERFYGYGGVDVSYPFYRPGRIALTFEPKVQLVAATGENDALEDFVRTPANLLAGVPAVAGWEDSFTAELNGSNLFSPNRFSGFDLVEEGAQVNAGAKLSADWESVGTGSVFFGRSYHTDPALFGPASGLDRKWSDYILETEFRTDHFGATTRLRIDPDDYKIERLETDGFVRWGPAYLGVGYYNLSTTFTGGQSQEYLRLDGSLRLTDNVSIAYGLSRDMANDRTQQSSFGVTYEDDCLILGVSYIQNQGSVTRAVQEFGGVFLTIGLKTIGTFGVG
jgi:LPS-assembly protein